MNTEFDNIDDNKSNISDITDTSTISSYIQKREDLKVKTEVELNKLTIDALKEKCKEINITNYSKMKKTELIELLITEYMNIWGLLSEKKVNDLKNICKFYNIKCISGLKKEELLWNIISYCSATLKFKVEDISPQINETNKLNYIEELEKQKNELEEKIKTEFNKIEEEKRIAEETRIAEEKRIAEEEKQKLEEEKKKEKEDAKKKKQSIPKNVRIIVWNHYIGEDIIKHRCLCCKKVIITNTNFEVGHVISEKQGGTHEINNLRPICGACNHSMGTENMIDFVVKYGLYIG